MQLERNQNTARTQPEYSQNATRTEPERNQGPPSVHKKCVSQFCLALMNNFVRLEHNLGVLLFHCLQVLSCVECLMVDRVRVIHPCDGDMKSINLCTLYHSPIFKFVKLERSDALERVPEDG